MELMSDVLKASLFLSIACYCCFLLSYCCCTTSLCDISLSAFLFSAGMIKLNSAYFTFLADLSILYFLQNLMPNSVQTTPTEYVNGSMISHPSQSTANIIYPKENRCTAVITTARFLYHAYLARYISLICRICSCVQAIPSWILTSSFTASCISYWQLVQFLKFKQFIISSLILSVSNCCMLIFLARQKHYDWSLRQQRVRQLQRQIKYLGWWVDLNSRRCWQME